MSETNKKFQKRSLIKYIGAAVLGTVTGGPLGLFASPIALKVSRERYKDEKTKVFGKSAPKSLIRWSQLGVVAGPALYGVAAIMGAFSPTYGDILNEKIEKVLEAPAEVTEANASETKKQIAALVADEEFCFKNECVSYSSLTGQISFDPDYTLADNENLDKLQEKYNLALRLEKQREDRIAAEEKRKAIADGSYMPYLSDVRPTCERMVEDRVLTGRVNWGWFNYDWDRSQKTLVLRGRTKNGFGVELPLVAKCRWEKGNMVRLLSLN